MALVVGVPVTLNGGITRPPEAATEPAPPPPPRAVVKIESIEPRNPAASSADVTWLGVYVEEASEALSAQLGLSSGEGLVITYIAADSPATKAGLQKSDVLVKFKDQLLVHPSQLIKLIRTRKDGDEVPLTFFRQGQRQTRDVKLARRPSAADLWALVSPSAGVGETNFSPAVTGILDANHGPANDLQRELMRQAAAKEKVRQEVERSIEEARQALQDALHSKGQTNAVIGLGANELVALANEGVDINDNCTVILKRNGQQVQTVVQRDETGSYLILATPTKRLVAHDRNGELIFDGEIETEEQQRKVPAAIWSKVRPLLEQLKSGNGKPTKPHAHSGDELKLGTMPRATTSANGRSSNETKRAGHDRIILFSLRHLA